MIISYIIHPYSSLVTIMPSIKLRLGRFPRVIPIVIILINIFFKDDITSNWVYLLTITITYYVVLFSSKNLAIEIAAHTFFLVSLIALFIPEVFPAIYIDPNTLDPIGFNLLLFNILHLFTSGLIAWAIWSLVEKKHWEELAQTYEKFIQKNLTKSSRQQQASRIQDERQKQNKFRIITIALYIAYITLLLTLLLINQRTINWLYILFALCSCTSIILYAQHEHISSYDYTNDYFLYHIGAHIAFFIFLVGLIVTNDPSRLGLIAIASIPAGLIAARSLFRFENLEGVEVEER